MKFFVKSKPTFTFFLFIIFILLIVSFLFSSFTSTPQSKINAVKCNQKYGLCPAAKCIPNPFDFTKAYCWCDVVTGENYSLGNNSCEKISPYTKNGQEFIYSTFSPLIENLGYHTVDCPPEDVNLNCMNKICSVDPNDGSKAICICDTTDNKGLNWVTFNKNNSATSCNYQSGASLQDYQTISSFISTFGKG
jgi:hypothetical protein